MVEQVIHRHGGETGRGRGLRSFQHDDGCVFIGVELDELLDEEHSDYVGLVSLVHGNPGVPTMD